MVRNPKWDDGNLKYIYLWDNAEETKLLTGCAARFQKKANYS